MPGTRKRGTIIHRRREHPVSVAALAFCEHPRGMAMRFETKRISAEPDAIAPDGSEVRVLCQLSRGGLAVFTLAPKAISKAVAHRTIEEVWYFISGQGRMWRKLGEHEEVVEVGPGVSISIPTGTHF